LGGAWGLQFEPERPSPARGRPSAFLGWLGLARRGLLSTAWVLILTPAHWLLLSLAAWLALYQVAVAPYAWEKTEHGLAKSSRRAANLTRSLLQLERYLSHFERTRQPADAGGRHYIYRRRSAAASAGLRLRLNGATKRPCLSIR
jgi:hypothetical protein